MKIALDVKYNEATKTALTVGVVFNDWSDAQATKIYQNKTECISEYIPGEFYRRELPCILAILSIIEEPLNLIIVDSYVDLGSYPGMGRHLWKALEEKVPIIGVAKTYFKEAQAQKVFRGQSKRPLYVTAAGIDLKIAASSIRIMHGKHRMPTLIKLADSLTNE